MSRIASVLLPMPLPEAFDYAEPEGLDLAVGDHVTVPLGPRAVRGVVTALREGAGGNRPLKPVLERLGDPPMPETTLRFVEWAARYSVDLPGQPLAMALRGLRAPKPRPIKLLALTGAAPARLTPAREKVLAVAAEGPLPGPELAAKAGVGAGVVKGLLEEGCLEVRLHTPETVFPEPDTALPGPTLNPSQKAAAQVLAGMVTQGGFQAALLDGVTGSGKTEVYLEAVAAALDADPAAQVLVLLPEIALTHAVIARFEDRFGVQPAEWHSAVPPPRRRQVWEGVATGRARIVVGARSALFLPFPNLRLIVVDEEHDGSFKQEEGFIDQARDLAVARASLEKCAVVLASATPSLESLWNAEQG
ncbi:MAG: DEAD/DEAH box helicase, partial [Caulobacter sp.]|nr:DEAD/DEAH box helicase [Caulobacter sp.]